MTAFGHAVTPGCTDSRTQGLAQSLHVLLACALHGTGNPTHQPKAPPVRAWPCQPTLQTAPSTS
eukprot:15468024-Alexandrium_andersonii.AAC.2